jgi:hypothetical protein
MLPVPNHVLNLTSNIQDSNLYSKLLLYTAASGSRYVIAYLKLNHKPQEVGVQTGVSVYRGHSMCKHWGESPVKPIPVENHLGPLLPKIMRITARRDNDYHTTLNLFWGMHNFKHTVSNTVFPYWGNKPPTRSDWYFKHIPDELAYIPDEKFDAYNIENGDVYLMPTLELYCEGEFFRGKKGLYVILLNNPIQDFEQVKSYSQQLIKGIADGSIPPLKFVLIAMNQNEELAGQMHILDHLGLRDGKQDAHDLWHCLNFNDVRDCPEHILDEGYGTTADQCLDVSARIVDDKGRVLANFPCLPLRFKFALKSDSEAFYLVINNDKGSIQPLGNNSEGAPPLRKIIAEPNDLSEEQQIKLFRNIIRGHYTGETGHDALKTFINDYVDDPEQQSILAGIGLQRMQNMLIEFSNHDDGRLRQIWLQVFYDNYLDIYSHHLKKVS